jgi:hypothetical protein
MTFALFFFADHWSFSVTLWRLSLSLSSECKRRIALTRTTS